MYLAESRPLRKPNTKKAIENYVYFFVYRSLTLREERRLRMFENRVLRRVFGLKRDQVVGE